MVYPMTRVEQELAVRRSIGTGPAAIAAAAPLACHGGGEALSRRTDGNDRVCVSRVGHYSGHMDTMVDGVSARLASTLKAEREARGWSQADLAARSGVSKAMISKVERAEASPTAAILIRLSAAFELTLATLLMRTEAQAGRHVAVAAQPVWRDPETGYVRRQLSASPSSPLELVRIELPAGACVPTPAASYTFIRQVVWLLEGHLAIDDGAERHALAPGDTYAFGEPADAAFVNDSGAPCVYLVAVSRR